MLPRRVLASLCLAATSVSAIDLRFFSNNNCKGNTWLACNNYNPGPCCYTTNQEYSVGGGWFAIPTSWSIVCQLWTTTGCSSGPLRATGLSNGRDTVCYTAPVDRQRGYAEGLSYYFNGKKREVNQDPAECQRANILHLDDGSEYDLAGLDAAAYDDVAQTLYQRVEPSRDRKAAFQAPRNLSELATRKLVDLEHGDPENQGPIRLNRNISELYCALVRKFGLSAASNHMAMEVGSC